MKTQWKYCTLVLTCLVYMCLYVFISYFLVIAVYLLVCNLGDLHFSSDRKILHLLNSIHVFLPVPVIAGQYDGRSKPLPEYHAKITGFDERVHFYCRLL